jgi:RNA polymerase-associated protein RTF1
MTDDSFQRELAQYKSVVTNDNQKLPTKKFLISKIDQINRLVNRSFTEAELQEKLKRSGVLQQKANAVERQRLEVARQEAENMHNEAAVAEIQARLKALEPPKLAFGTSLQPHVDNKPREKSQQERLAELNRANRKANTRDIRKAQLAERKAHKMHREAMERGEATADPFARVKVMAKTYYDVNAPTNAEARKSPPQTPTSKATTPTPTPLSSQQKAVSPAAAATVKKEGTFDYAQYDPMVALGKLAPGAAVDENGERKSVFKRKMCDDEILANMDFGLDLDIEVL